MKHCIWDGWICPLASGNHLLVWKSLLFYFDKSTWTVLSVLTWRPMPLPVFSRLCSRDSAWAGVFAISIIVWVGYCLLLTFSNVKPFPFIKSINFQSISIQGRLLTIMGLVYIPLQNTCDNVKEVSDTIRWTNFYFHVFVEHHYSWDGCFEENIG